MEKERRTVIYDEDLKIEAYQLTGIMQRFPNHFHEYYVIGYLEKGSRRLFCKGREYDIREGDMLLINPLDNHSCCQIDENAMDWRCLNITKEVMAETLNGMHGSPHLPVFSQTLLKDSPHVSILKELHQVIMTKGSPIHKEELFYFLLEQLAAEYGGAAKEQRIVSRQIEKACAYMEHNYTGQISLETLSHVSGLNKYTLLRTFTRQVGVTPYQYLETLRISQAKKLLEQGFKPAVAALETGFSDQSHFTRFFKNIIGLTPKQYQKIFYQEEES